MYITGNAPSWKFPPSKVFTDVNGLNDDWRDSMYWLWVMHTVCEVLVMTRCSDTKSHYPILLPRMYIRTTFPPFLSKFGKEIIWWDLTQGPLNVTFSANPLSRPCSPINLVRMSSNPLLWLSTNPWNNSKLDLIIIFWIFRDVIDEMNSNFQPQPGPFMTLYSSSHSSLQGERDSWSTRWLWLWTPTIGVLQIAHTGIDKR